MRGSTSVSTGSTPVASSASISSFSFIEPISAANALPVRPATMIAVSSTPSSRSTPTVIEVDDVDVGAVVAQLAARTGRR